MALEIERKFLVTGNAWRTQGSSVVMRQGYLSADVLRTVRVRIVGDQAWLTIKGKNQGAVRHEFEYPIALEDAQTMLETMALRPLIEKTRTRIRVGDHLWEVDAFEGDNAGLVVAEIELHDADEAFEKPDWLGKEVTGDARYYNSSLIAHPYSQWEK